MSAPVSITTEEIRRRVSELGEWFHNIDLDGVPTAPNHFLGDYPSFKWRMFESSLPADLSGKTVLDVGCNAGFYSIQMKRRGAARVVGIDSDPAKIEVALRHALPCKVVWVYEGAPSVMALTVDGIPKRTEFATPPDAHTQGTLTMGRPAREGKQAIAR